MKGKKIKIVLSLIFVLNLLFAYTAFAKSSVRPYQGIFAKDDKYLSIALYTDIVDKEIGPLYLITKPVIENNYVQYDIIESLGDIMDIGNDSYECSNNSSLSIDFHNGYIDITDNSNRGLSGKYIQISNSGADMNPRDIWLDFSKLPNHNIKVLLNNKELTFDQPPVIIDNRTLVPLRAIFEAMGATVDWDDSTKTVTSIKNNITIQLTIGSNVMYKNDTPISLDVPAQIINDRTMVPVRAIAEAFGADVSWDGDTKTVYIN